MRCSSELYCQYLTVDLIRHLFQRITGVMVTEICVSFVVFLIIDDVSLFLGAKMLDWVEIKKQYSVHIL